MDIYDEDSQAIGLYAICKWWLQSYPEDIFKTGPSDIVTIREAAKRILDTQRPGLALGLAYEGRQFLPLKHTSECRWSITTPSECAYRSSHHYCPHTEHACDCEGVRSTT